MAKSVYHAPSFFSMTFQTEILSNEISDSLKQIVVLKPFNSLSTRDKKAECADSVDLNEVDHIESPHLNLHCLPFSL